MPESAFDGVVGTFREKETGMRVFRALLALLPIAGGFACSKEMGPPQVTPDPDPPIPAALSGQALYHNLRCVNCHGVDGRGSQLFPGAPTLIGRTADDIRVSVVTPCENP